jgi:hypothetical protein
MRWVTATFLAVVAALCAATGSAPAARTGSAAPTGNAAGEPCPLVAYQPAAAGFYWLQPVVSTVQGERLRVRFRYINTAGGEAYVIKYYAIRDGRVKMTAVRQRRASRGVTTYERTCVPRTRQATTRRPGRYRAGVSLPAGFAWKVPGDRVAPGPRVTTTQPVPGAPVGAASGAPEPAPVPGVPAGAPPSDALPAPGPGPGPAPAPGPVAPSWTVLTAGDVANCFNNVKGKPAMGQHPGQPTLDTAAVIKAQLPVDDLIVQGDLAYESGTAAELRDCYDTTWGAFKSFSHPAPGNHEYRSKGAAPYYAYWGPQAGPASRGYYSYDVGPWHVVSLNTEVDYKAAGQQAAWLRADLAAHPNRCTMAFWHRPRWSNDPIHGDSPWLDGLYRILYDAGVDVLLQGHAHAYERWSEMAPDATVEPGRGVRTFVVGTGGAESMDILPQRPGEEVSQGKIYGVMKLTLTADDYSWEFLPTGGSTFADSGTTRCH